LSFLPTLPSQILLNNLLYDASQLAIPTDHVDAEQLQRPSHWDIAFIRRFILFFGPISSLFDFLTFAIIRGGFHAGPELFRTGWFVESLATQTLIIFAVRTRRVPFWRSRPSWTLTAAALGIVAVGIGLPETSLGSALGFSGPPGRFFAVLIALIAGYVLLIEIGKRLFYTDGPSGGPLRPSGPGLPGVRSRRLHRHASPFAIVEHPSH
jgi:Mg2+-importing ATPase